MYIWMGPRAVPPLTSRASPRDTFKLQQSGQQGQAVGRQVQVPAVRAHARGQHSTVPAQAPPPIRQARPPSNCPAAHRAPARDKSRSRSLEAWATAAKQRENGRPGTACRPRPRYPLSSSRCGGPARSALRGLPRNPTRAPAKVPPCCLRARGTCNLLPIRPAQKAALRAACLPSSCLLADAGPSRHPP